MDRAVRSRRRLSLAVLLGALLAGVGLIVGACSGSDTAEPPATTQAPAPVPAPPPSPTPVDGGVLRVASGPLPADLSPAASVWDTSAQQLARGLYDRLAVYDVNNLPRPELAESIESDATFTRWTIRVRRGVLFHDGTPFDASAVVANLEAQRTSPLGTHLLTPVTTVVATNSRTVVVTMSTSWSTFPEVLATQIGAMASPGTLVAAGAVAPIGTGPFRFPPVDGQGGEAPDSVVTVTPAVTGEVQLVRNPSYWRAGLPRLDAVRFLVIPEPGSRVSAVLRDEADLVSTDRPAQLSRLDGAAADGTVRVTEDRNAEAPKVAIALDTARAPFDSITARRAASLATDREQLSKLAMQGQGTVARGIISDPSPWYTDLPEPVPDLNRAKDEVASYIAEFGQPITAELLVPDDPFLLSIATVWRAQQATVGITITIKPVPLAELGDLTARGQYQAALVEGFVSPHPDLYEPLLRGLPGEQPAVNLNITRYVNPLITQAFADARATSDPALQVDTYRVVQEQLFLDVPWLFLLQLRQVVATSPSVRDVTGGLIAAGGRGLGQDGAAIALAPLRLVRPPGSATEPLTSATSVDLDATGGGTG